MLLGLYNTMTRRKEPFIPLDLAHVRMYVCGPTVYDQVHIGNARPVVVFDTLYRLLKRLYPRVTYVRNITDVDDKINNRALESGQTIKALTDEIICSFHEDIAALNAIPPDVEPRATAHITEMLVMIKQLLKRGHAYIAAGHVLFSVVSDTVYGCLSGRSRDEMIAGARVEIAPYKRDPADFVLWKPSPSNLPGWDSPWGRGRPGWHIECSAMSRFYLGETFDIHGGGQDLIFPHHENEIAQSTCANGTPFVHYWLHNGWVMANGEKMSKSLSNFITVRRLLEQGVHGETLRLAMLATHYHQPLDWSEDSLRQAKLTLDRFYTALQMVSGVQSTPGERETLLEEEQIEDYCSGVLNALCDDLNTPRAISALHEITTALNKATCPDDRGRLKKALRDGGLMLGVLISDPEIWLKGESGVSTTTIEALITHREAARRARDFTEADRIREVLRQMGVVLNDSTTGTTWRVISMMGEIKNLKRNGYTL